MKLYIKQHVFSWGDKFSIYDEDGVVRYTVSGEVFTFGKKLHLETPDGLELAYIEQEVFTFRPRFMISRNGNTEAEVVKHFTLFSNEFSVEGPGWTVSGDFMDHDYTIYENGSEIADIEREWFTFGDAYSIEFDDNADVVMILAVIIAIDAIMTEK